MMNQEHEAMDRSYRDPAHWAQRFAQRRRKAQEDALAIRVTAEEKIATAVEALWTMFDDALTQVTQALERSGAQERVVADRTCREYRLTMSGRDGELRHIALFAGLREVNGQPSGRSQITTTQTRAAISLRPIGHGSRLHWVTAEGGREFTARVLDDLLLSTFTDDGAATLRLAPYFTLTS